MAGCVAVCACVKASRERRSVGAPGRSHRRRGKHRFFYGRPPPFRDPYQWVPSGSAGLSPMSSLPGFRKNQRRRSSPRSRTGAFLLVAALVGVPAGVMRVMCVGGSCERASASSETPYCSLPSEIRTLIRRGFYDGRSPDLLAVTEGETVVGGSAFNLESSQPTWPSVALDAEGRVPIVFWGQGVRGGEIGAAAGLEDIAPTVADIIGLKRPHPEVRSGRALEDLPGGQRPRLVVQVVWKGVETQQLLARPSSWPTLRRLLADGSGTTRGSVGSLPLDPAAALTTIGTGGLPYQHGMTGALVRNEKGRVVPAWGSSSPTNVIATLGDDLDERLRQEPLIGLVGTNVMDRGLVGGDWYPGSDQDPVDLLHRTATTREQTSAALRMLRRDPFGKDATPDLLAVALSGSVSTLDANLSRLITAAEEVAGRSAAVVVTATGDSGPSTGRSIAASRLERSINEGLPMKGDVVEATGIGGLFVDQRELARARMSEDRVLRPLLTAEGPQGARLMADAFPAIAVSLSRFC